MCLLHAIVEMACEPTARMMMMTMMMTMTRCPGEETASRPSKWQTRLLQGPQPPLRQYDCLEDYFVS